MSGIFISYRRAGASMMAYRIADELKRTFGNDSIFLDVESIDPGVPFAQAIQSSLNRCSVALIVMGPEWLTMTDDDGNRRLENPDDWVRQEVRLALESKLRVIPVLVKGAVMPNAGDLPSDIQRLSSLHAFSFIDSQTHWAFDVQRLQDQICDIDKRLAKRRKFSPNKTSGSDSYSIKAIIGLVVGLFFFVGAVSSPDYINYEEVLGALLVIVVPLLLCFFAWKDIRAGLKKGMAFVIGGGVLSVLAMLITFGQMAEMSFDNAATATLVQEREIIEAEVIPDVQEIQNNNLSAASAVTAVPAPPAEPARPQVMNIGGSWISDEGLTYFIRQNGDSFSFIENNIFGVKVGQGQGQVRGNKVTYTYHNFMINVSGTGTGTVSDDVMALYYTDQFNNSISYEVYRE